MYINVSHKNTRFSILKNIFDLLSDEKEGKIKKYGLKIF